MLLFVCFVQLCCSFFGSLFCSVMCSVLPSSSYPFVFPSYLPSAGVVKRRSAFALDEVVLIVLLLYHVICTCLFSLFLSLSLSRSLSRSLSHSLSFSFSMACLMRIILTGFCSTFKTDLSYPHGIMGNAFPANILFCLFLLAFFYVYNHLSLSLLTNTIKRVFFFL